jgi:3-hydroxyisobutyrate dehydrogenase-like beta-hydroxyacid dehydrogenase
MKSNGTAVLQQGAAFIECPVGGTVGPAKEGKLLGLVGGTKPEVARAMPILEQLCRRTEHVGDLGSGSIMKLAVNLPLLVYWQALGEALTICKPLNLPAARLSPRYWAERRSVKPRSASTQRKRIWQRPSSSARQCMPSFPSQPAPLPAMTKPKWRALAMQTQPQFRPAGPNAGASRSLLNLSSRL